MMNYVIYKSDFGYCIVEVLNLNDNDMLEVQQSITKQGYIITEVCGSYIKCYKKGELESI